MQNFVCLLVCPNLTGHLYNSLAYCELYLAMAVLVQRVYPRLRLYEATIDDIKFDSDYFMPCIKNGREGLRAYVLD